MEMANTVACFCFGPLLAPVPWSERHLFLALTKEFAVGDLVVHCGGSLGSGEHCCLLLLWAPLCPGAVVRTAFFRALTKEFAMGDPVVHCGREGRPLRESFGKRGGHR